MRNIAALFIGALLIGAASADDDDSATYNRINLSVSAEQQVVNDTVIAELFSEREGEQASRIAAEVNENIAWAVERAQLVEQVSVQTTGYHSQPVYHKQTVVGWRVRQSIRLESRDATGLSTLIGELQQRLAMGSITYAISPGLRAQAENELITQALASFSERAKLITKELGRSDYRIVRLDVGTSGTPVQRMRAERMAASMDAAAPPVIEGGVQIVRVGVNGTIELKPD